MQQQKKEDSLDDQQGQKDQTSGEKKKNKRKRNRRKRRQGSNNVREIEADSANIGDGELPLNSTLTQKQMAKPVTPVASRKAAGSNWELAMGKTPPAKDNKNMTDEPKSSAVNNNSENISPGSTNATAATTLTKAQRHRQKRRAAYKKYVAMDCEMVGVGLNGQDDMLARVSIVDKRGEVLLDKFVKPQETVVCYRTSISGIRPHDMENGEDMNIVQDEVVQILQDKILIGHGINKDLAVLRIKHPASNIRDTAFYKPLRRLVANGRTPSLKRLSQAILGKEIQTGEHNSVEDARAVMAIYNCLSNDWEQYIKRHEHRKDK